MKIREMHEADLPRVTTLAWDMHQESFYRENDFQTKKVRAIWDQHIALPGAYCLMVAEDEDDIIGVFAGFTFEHFFGNDRVSSDLILYVTPEHRGGSAAPRLIKAYEKWARSSGVREIQIGVSTGVREERTARFFEKLGFGDRAIYYRKRV